MKKLNQKDSIQLLHFIIDNVMVCVDLKYIHKVMSLVELETVPNSPPYLAGLMNYKGNIIPTIDLKIYAGMPSTNAYTIYTPLIICSDGQKKMGLLVDSVLDITQTDNNDIDMDKQFNESDSLFSAVVKTNDKQSLLINIENILNDNVLQKNRLKAKANNILQKAETKI